MPLIKGCSAQTVREELEELTAPAAEFGLKIAEVARDNSTSGVEKARTITSLIDQRNLEQNVRIGVYNNNRDVSQKIPVMMKGGT